MVYIVTSFDKLAGANIIFDVDIYFDEIKREIIKCPLYKKIIKAVDNAMPTINDGIQTPFGNTVVDNLSTGCKALLIAVYDTSKWVNFLEAGTNVLREAISIAKEHNIDIHIILPCNMMLASMDEKVSIDNKIITIREYILQGNKANTGG